MHGKRHSLPGLNGQDQMPIKDTRVIEAKRGFLSAANLKRKTAGYDARARLLSGKNVQLNHLGPAPVNGNFIVWVNGPVVLDRILDRIIPVYDLLSSVSPVDFD